MAFPFPFFFCERRGSTAVRERKTQCVFPYFLTNSLPSLSPLSFSFSLPLSLLRYNLSMDSIVSNKTSAGHGSLPLNLYFGFTRNKHSFSTLLDLHLVH